MGVQAPLSALGRCAHHRGGLVFGGSQEGNFYALDAETGEPLWQFQTGGAIRANPISFSMDGAQQIAIAAGSVLYVFGL